MTLAPLILPKPLTGVAESLTRAIREVAIIDTWPEDKPAFLSAPQPESIMKVLIPVLHQHLDVPRKASIVCLFREEMERRGRVRLGVAGKASSKITYLTGHDFTLEFNWTYWTKLSPPQRIALVDHELSHCGVNDKGNWMVVPHDVEEFATIVRRWGLWTPDLVEFNGAIKSMQTDLFQAAE